MESSPPPLISVIVPCYNYGSLLKDCVDCLIAQTYSNWECIIIDDGSTDNTRQIAESLIQGDSRISYFVQDNSGPTVARNSGLTKAKGEFIQFLDADDLLENMKFEKQLALFQKNSDVDLVYGNVKYFRTENVSQQFDNMSLEGSKPWMKKLSGSGEKLIKAFLSENQMVIQAPLFKKTLTEKFGKMDESLHYNEDWELWTRFAIGNAKFLFDESAGTNSLVRVHDSYSKDNLKMFIHGLHASLKMDRSITGRQYKKILIPKIAYHKKIIDERLIATLRKDPIEAAATAAVVYDVTGEKRYQTYSRLFGMYPVWFWYLYSKFLAIINKLKNTILYG